MKRNGILCAVAAVTGFVTLFCIIAGNVTEFTFSRTTATNSPLLLEHGDITNLDNTYKDGVFATKTNLNNDLNWEYKYGKSSNGLIEIGKNVVGNTGCDNYYIGNTTAITSISSVTVSFTGSPYAYIYGSPDQAEYYLVDTLTSESNTSTRIAKYQYFRITNGSQDLLAMTINSISISYDCLVSEDTDEVVDITSNQILQDSGNVLSLDTSTKYDGYKSQHSLKIVAPSSGNTGTWVISLGGSYTGKELKKASLTYYANSIGNSDYDSSHKYTRFMIYPANGTSRVSGNPYFQTGNLNNGTDWTKYTVTFASMTALSDNAVVNSLYIKSVYATDGIYMDQMHLSLGMEDLDPAIINAYEADDMISEDIHFAYGTVSSIYDYSHHSLNSVRSSKITIDSNWRMWYYNDTGMGDNLNDYVVSFDLLCANFTDGKTAGAISYKFNYDGNRYSIDFSKNPQGLTITLLENGWTHYVLDINEIRDGLDASTDTDLTNLGFNVGYARTIYVDNLHVTKNDSPSVPAIVLNYPENGAIQPMTDEAVSNYYHELHTARDSVENDYVLDLSEIDPENHNHPRISDYAETNKYHDSFASFSLKYRIYNYSTTSVKIHLATKNDFSDERVITTTSLKSYELSNLLRNKTYYWNVETSDENLTSETYSFTTDDTSRFIAAGAVHNMRDVGGYMTKSGKRIKQGLIFRGMELNAEEYYDQNSGHHYKNLETETIALLKDELGIGFEFDLRSPKELPATSDSGLGQDVDYETIGEYCPSYTGISKNSYNVNRFVPLFRSFLTANTKHVYFHCWGGADRTGTVGFILGGFLGMSFTDLCIEYENTSYSKNLRQRDVTSDYGSFPDMITELYNNVAGYDQTGNHDIQEICTNLLLTAGMTQEELNTLTSTMLED